MPTLVIPDIHERLDRLAEALRGRSHLADHIVFLGDWFDAFGRLDGERLIQLCHFMNGMQDGIVTEQGPKPKTVKVTRLLGNHDCHYFYAHNGFKCSGYSPVKQSLINGALDPQVPRQFKMFTRVGPYLISHAGFHHNNLRFASQADEAQALEDAQRGMFHPLFWPGRARGGWAERGGPTWLDWMREFEHIDNTPQIVGHTHGKDVRVKGSEGPAGSTAVGHPSWCIDTGCHHVLWIEDDGTARVEQIGPVDNQPVG